MSTSKSETKEKIKKLVERYKQVKKSRQRKTYDEANTRKDFIMPLFQALGWDIHSEVIKREVVEEATAVKGRVDYSFQINNIPKFLLEAKALKIDLEKPEWAEQAVTYGWNKGIPWVVLSNFEKLKVFNSDWKVDKPRPNINLSYEDYIEKFNLLWLLSKEASEANELDKLLSQFGITAKRVNVNEKLADDLTRWRNILTNNLSQWNTKIKLPDIEEAVQRILDRLIFIRVVEDREIEGKILWQTFQKWETDIHQQYNFIEALVPVFRDFDKKYNSNLFLPHLCEKLKTEGDPFHKIIPELYGNKEAGVKYRFDAIGADVLGSVYEQYLGYVQQRQGTKSKRKKQGIYYTPAYIVDYIVQNTLGAFLKKATLQEAANIKILDPACGSGSFLIRAFEVLDAHLKVEKAQRNAGSTTDALRKYDILTQNIYGVDLDSQAIEIARLNLMLKALVPGHRLPLLTEHMRIGNSLISGTEKELKKYFGKNYQTKKPFNWNEEFKEAFNQGGFDVIVGNPPYVRSRNIDEEEREYFSDAFESAFRTFDVYLFFLEKSLNLLKDGGLMGFIIPYSFLTQPYAAKLRKLLLEKSAILEILDLSPLKVFQDAQVKNCIIICQKKARPSKVSVTAFEGGEIKTTTRVDQNSFFSNPDQMFKIELTEGTGKLISKIEEGSILLSKVVYVSKGIEVYERDSEKTKDEFIFTAKEDRRYKPYLEAKEIFRYGENWEGRYIFYQPERHCSGKFPELFENDKIVMKRIIGERRLCCHLDRKNYYVENTLICLLPKKTLREKFGFSAEECRLSEKYGLPFLLTLLNSKLMTYYFKMKFGDKLQIYNRYVKLLPIKAGKVGQNKLVSLANKMLTLNRDLQICAEDSDKYRAIHAEIEKVDKQIDQLVYKLYNLTPEEIEIVEGDVER